MQVVVTSLSGRSCTISADATWTVDDLRTVVRECMDIHVVEQRLIYGTTILEGPEAVSSLHTQMETEESVLHLTLVRLDLEAAQWLRRLSGSCHYSVFREAPEPIRNSRDMVLAAVCRDANVLQHAEEKFWYDLQIVTIAVENNASIFQDLPEAMRGHREIVKAAICKDGRNLEFAEKFHSDLELVSVAVTTHAKALFLCPRALWNPQLVLQAVKTAKQSKYRSLVDSFIRCPELQALFAEKEFMLAAIDKDPMFLLYASEALKMDGEVVSRAVRNDWHALEHAGYGLKCDREIACMALAQSPLALQFVGPQFQDDEELVHEAVRRDSTSLKFASRRLLRDDVTTALAWFSYTTTQSF